MLKIPIKLLYSLIDEINKLTCTGGIKYHRMSSSVGSDFLYAILIYIEEHCDYSDIFLIDMYALLLVYNYPLDIIYDRITLFNDGVITIEGDEAYETYHDTILLGYNEHHPSLQDSSRFKDQRCQEEYFIYINNLCSKSSLINTIKNMIPECNKLEGLTQRCYSDKPTPLYKSEELLKFLFQVEMEVKDLKSNYPIKTLIPLFNT